MKAINLNETISLVQNSNSPFLHFCKVTSETEKAVKLENEYKKTAWIPKKALKYIDSIDSFTFEQWFRNNDEAIKNAFRLFN